MPRTINKSRSWSHTVSMDARWKPNGRLARHRPYFFYEDDEITPCDSRGYRIPPGFESITEKYTQTGPDEKVFCYGGSTTFGIYCAYEESYPHQLENISSKPCFNMGLQTFDLYANLICFVDHLRDGLIPDIAIFLDGVNESQGYMQAVLEGREEYVAEFRQYRGFKDIIKNASFKYRARRFFGFENMTSNDFKEGDSGRFAKDQAVHFVNSVNAITQIAEAYRVRTVFLLQPVVWDIWKDDIEDPRYVYLKDLYEKIVVRSGGSVIDISEDVSLVSEEFYDWAHLSSKGNAALAHAVALKVF